ncbi:hypothetical protein SAMN06269185_1658 [Natronoarchaeum philippinense]|jgi:hypothetical protein|uniref:Uncharacterized protein n=1 Tax=Natronoarchaeum philippinense TaxID=558529 RepID=A0A285NWU7_NATPI|nr:hypothetical protein [Natronoarchaeum philippinense]SNZ12366.1 hypothetical protein SAMN06269185_1658 [Natronoarchaeum philippinense]
MTRQYTDTESASITTDAELSRDLADFVKTRNISDAETVITVGDGDEAYCIISVYGGESSAVVLYDYVAGAGVGDVAYCADVGEVYEGLQRLLNHDETATVEEDITGLLD